MAYSANRYAVTFNVGSDTKKVEICCCLSKYERYESLMIFE